MANLVRKAVPFTHENLPCQYLSQNAACSSSTVTTGQHGHLLVQRLMILIEAASAEGNRHGTLAAPADGKLLIGNARTVLWQRTSTVAFDLHLHIEQMHTHHMEQSCMS